MQALMIRKAEIARKQGNSETLAEVKSKTLARKLWDGKIRLNSSVLVSLVAFFKSGEKLPDTRWSEFVEVKGKVKLEDFEKYIEELSRSRNRGLMVTSLCWKEGTSESGFVGMKKVADGYKADRKVGLARISEGMHLYVCPRTDPIITILAKHGFFKGMSAIEENQDSLIGCFVWRRGSVLAQKSKKTNQSLNRISDNAKQRVDNTDLSCKKAVPDSVVKDCSTPESAISDGSEDKNTERIVVDQFNLQNSSASSDLLQAHSVLTKSTSIAAPRNSGPTGEFSEAPPTQKLETERPKPSCGIQNSVFPLSPVVVKNYFSTPTRNSRSMGQFSKSLHTQKLEIEIPKPSSEIQNSVLPPVVAKDRFSTPAHASPKNSGTMGQFSEAPPPRKLEIEKPKPCSNIQNSVLLLSPVVTNYHFSTLGHYELPEFDVRPAYFKSQTARDHIYENIYPSMPSRAVSLDSIPALNKRKYENVNPFGSSTDAVLKLPRLMEVSDHRNVAASPNLSKRIAQSRALIRLYGSASDQTSENCFDGDKPVWCSPEPTLYGICQSSPAISGIPRSLPQPISGHPRPLPFSPRAFTYMDQSARNFGIIPTQTRPGNEFLPPNPTPPMRFHANTSVWPPRTWPFDLGPPIHPYGSRVLW